MHLFDKILIANRGEIAVRIIKTAQKLGIATVAIFSPADRNSLGVKLADEAWPLGSNTLSESYLNIDKIIQIALLSGSQAIHPGYGFLSENPRFAQACADNNLVFIGPRAASMELMGNKIASREFVEKLGIPMTKGMTGMPEEIYEQAKDASFPLLIKAAAGGGGKGMKIVEKGSDLLDSLETASREALSYFGDGSVFAEKYIEKPRHIEIQLIGDQHGNVIHLFERECSIQRRYQKIIEEAPASHLPNKLRQEIAQAAVKIAQATNYQSAGTIEFLVENETNFYFLEMNTRIQVEHPVSELITGIDIVEEQIRIAAGYPLRFQQSDIQANGHAIECRIYAEDASNQFMPAPGNIAYYSEPDGNKLRIDTSLFGPATIESFYDPMISKFIVHKENREEAIEKSIQYLQEYIIQGIKHNIPYLLSILSDPAYRSNAIWTKFCETNLAKNLEQIETDRNTIPKEHVVLAFSAYTLLSNQLAQKDSIWQKIGYWRESMNLEIAIDSDWFQVKINQIKHQHIHLTINDQPIHIEVLQIQPHFIQLLINNIAIKASITELENATFDVMLKGHNFLAQRSDYLAVDKKYVSKGNQNQGFAEVKSPMPGKIVKIKVSENDSISQGDILLIVESMKMENNILAPGDGTITGVYCSEGDLIDSSKTLIRIE